MRLAFADAGNDPTGSTTRAGLRPARRGLRPGVQRPADPRRRDARRRRGRPRCRTALDAVGHTPGVAFGRRRRCASPSGAGASVARSSRPPRRRTEATEPARPPPARRRDARRPRSSGAVAHVGGQTAADIDFSDRCSSRACRSSSAPCCVLSFLLLMAVFRSVLVPLKAVVMNLLSIGAAYGVMVAVFQWGWFGALLGVQRRRADRAVGADDAVRHRLRPLDGLRGLPALAVKEEYDRTGDNSHGRRRRPGLDGAGHHRRRGHHGVRVRQLRARRRPRRSS